MDIEERDSEGVWYCSPYDFKNLPGKDDGLRKKKKQIQVLFLIILLFRGYSHISHQSTGVL